MPPKVSVLMTTYNRAKYVGFAIESVIASTFTDFELIIVDDRSTDDTVEIAQKYASSDSRIRVVVNENNLGDYPNRNRAASLAIGEYIKYVDADDYIYPTGLSTLVEMMSKYPNAGYGLCSLIQLREGPFPICLTPRQAYVHHFFRRSLFHKAPLSSIIRKSAWEHVGGFSHERMVSDSDMWYRLSREFDVVLMPLGIVWYRQHDEQEVSEIAREPIRYRTRYEAVVQRALASKDAPLTSSEKRRICKSFISGNLSQATKCAIRGRLNDAIVLLQNARAFRAILGETKDVP